MSPPPPGSPEDDDAPPPPGPPEDDAPPPADAPPPTEAPPRADTPPWEHHGLRPPEDLVRPVDELPPRRLHPAFVATAALRAVGQLVVPLVVAAAGLGGVGTGTVALGVLAVAVGGLVGWLQWRAVRYRVSDGALRVRRGLISPDERVVPATRIAALDERRGLVQRAFGVRGLQVRTAGGGRAAEVVLDALDDEALAALREVLAVGAEARAARAPGRATAGHPSAPTVSATHDAAAAGHAAAPTAHAVGAAAAPPAVPDDRRADDALAEHATSGGRLLLAAATSPAIGLVGSALGGLAGLLGQAADDGVGALAGPALERLGGARPTVAGVLALVATALLVIWLLAIALELVRLHRFRVRRVGAHLRVRHGLVPERQASVPLERIRAVRVVEGLLRQPLGVCEVRLEVAGYAKDDATTQLLLPLVRRDELGPLLHRLLPELPVTGTPLTRPPRRALVRALARRAALLLPPGVGVVLLAPGPVAAGATIAVAAAAVAQATAAWRAAGAALDDDVLRMRRRTLARTTLVADARRLQRIELRSTPPGRRARLTRLAARPASARAFGVADLDGDDARRLVDAVRGRGARATQERRTRGLRRGCHPAVGPASSGPSPRR